MSNFSVRVGLAVSLLLTILGLSWLPQPGIYSVEAIFTAIWLIMTLMAGAAFGKELWCQERLNRIRKRWKEQSSQERVQRSSRSAQRSRDRSPKNKINRQRARRSG